MTNPIKAKFLEQLRDRFGQLTKLDGSQSLYELTSGSSRIYIRYSRIHSRRQGFYGLRKSDMDQLDGARGFVVFLWDGQELPLIIPASHIIELLDNVSPALDGQYKAGVFLTDSDTELYFPSIGRFGVDGFYGWEHIESAIDEKIIRATLQYSHSQWQTIVGSIGAKKGFEVWIPKNNRGLLDWTIAPKFSLMRSVPPGFSQITNVIGEVDVMWVPRGGQGPSALFEIEYTTPIYSGLLRFNDVHLVAPNLKPRFHIVANEERRGQFVRLINRPTFRVSGLADICSFLEYQQVGKWHEKIINNEF